MSRYKLIIMEIWQKIKNLYTGDNTKFAWFVTLWLLYFSWSWLYGSGNTFFVWMDAKKEYREKTAQIKTLDEKMQQMEQEMNHRESSLDTLEKYAREHYYMAAPNEDVYIIER